MTPTKEFRLMNPLHRMVCMLENLFFIRMATSPIYLGISWAHIAIIIGTNYDFMPDAKPTPIPNPSMKL